MQIQQPLNTASFTDFEQMLLISLLTEIVSSIHEKPQTDEFRIVISNSYIDLLNKFLDLSKSGDVRRHSVQSSAVVGQGGTL
ncbi:MAG: hypothetical protein U1D70_14155 [Methylobacter sp.]|nr:hypothetical protein [Methylobacter sp.]MDP2427260.1 hypothetical protein [Methylobacter sp.]MDP3054454.1 hypothetical protein [Methylobacter sp.]MDP3362820.1 hypothetical protein [Methylobacter sp.]MDZ4220148.1 hypothetical protein [Methylobacter sp.]